MAEAYDVTVAPHSPLGPVALASCLHVDACTPNAIVQEQILLQDDVPTYLEDELIFEHIDGYADLPSEPGLGVNIDEDALREAETEDAWNVPVMRHRDGSIAEW